MANNKYYCSEQIMDIFHAMSKKRQIETLLNALGLMSSCNSQSETMAIAKSMGFKNDTGREHEYYAQKNTNPNT